MPHSDTINKKWPARATNTGEPRPARSFKRVSKPPTKPYSVTVFLVEGNKIASVVTTIAGRSHAREELFQSPEAALVWCRAKRANLVYSHPDASQN